MEFIAHAEGCQGQVGAGSNGTGELLDATAGTWNEGTARLTGDGLGPVCSFFSAGYYLLDPIRLFETRVRSAKRLGGPEGESDYLRHLC